MFEDIQALIKPGYKELLRSQKEWAVQADVLSKASAN